jgi:hypothetical protein
LRDGRSGLLLLVTNMLATDKGDGADFVEGREDYGVSEL